jgi:hypothetical protein
MPRGGARKGAGAKKRKPECGLADGNKDFATRVLARVGKDNWLKYVDIKQVKSDEDYALHLLVLATTSFRGSLDQFHKLLDRKYGRAVQQVRIANPKDETFNIDLDVTRVREKLLAKLGG